MTAFEMVKSATGPMAALAVCNNKEAATEKDRRWTILYFRIVGLWEGTVKEDAVADAIKCTISPNKHSDR